MEELCLKNKICVSGWNGSAIACANLHAPKTLASRQGHSLLFAVAITSKWHSNVVKIS